MSDAEHLIENVIYGMLQGLSVDEILDKPVIQDQLRLTGIRPGDIWAMAQHVVYGLYDGKFPEFSIDELAETTMTPEEFYHALEDTFKSHDIAGRHAEADDIMCELLGKLGYEDGVELFHQAYKWYD